MIISCKQSDSNPNITKEAIQSYPTYVQNVLDAHGGLNQWNKLKSLKYEIEKEGGNEKQFINLSDRKERIEAPNFTMGYDGKNYWMEADTSVKTNPVFYKNLMFYFYAMPFVLADQGIQYEEVDSLIYENITYPGFKVSYGKEVGVSPEDEYYLYYDQKTHEMAWLAYTVTYFSKEKSKKLGWIRYDDWQTVSDVKLPATMAWQKVEENKPMGERNRRTFANVMLSTDPLEDSVFQQTEDAKIYD